MSPARLDLVARIREVQFAPVRLREGYDMSEVDDFLDELEAVVSAGRPLAPLVDAARFATVRLREGYYMDDVDSFLAEIVRLSTDPASLPGATTASSTATADGPSHPVETGRAAVPTTSVISEQRGLISRLFGRNQ